MATRSGDVPQDLLFYLLRRKQFDQASLEEMLYKRAGLLGLSGVSGDMRILQRARIRLRSQQWNISFTRC